MTLVLFVKEGMRLQNFTLFTHVLKYVFTGCADTQTLLWASPSGQARDRCQK